MAQRMRLTSIVIGMGLAILTACATSPVLSPTASLPAATVVQPAPATEAPPAEALPTPERTFAVIETLAPEETVGEIMKPTPEVPYVKSLVLQAKEDLAGRLNIPVESIEFLAFEDVVWPDGSLGCPMPGMAYTQVLVEGYRILLQYEGQVYAYHGGGSRPPFLCQNPQK